MSDDYKTTEDMKEDLKVFIGDHYNDTLPPRINHVSVDLLWRIADRMKMFKSMAKQNDLENVSSDFLWAVYHDYEMFFYGILYSNSVDSDNFERLEARTGELEAQLGYNVSGYARNG